MKQKMKHDLDLIEVNQVERFEYNSHPKGWYLASYSSEVEKGEVKRLKYFGQELVIFRGENDQVTLLDAWCVHLGTHLGLGGKVVGDNISCPMHGWEFNGEGALDNIPYGCRDKPSLKIKKWITLEKDGFIWMYYDPENNEPNWEPPNGYPGEPEKWTSHRADENKWIITGFPQVIHENAYDAIHFEYLHGLKKPKSLRHKIISSKQIQHVFEQYHDYKDVGIDDYVRVETEMNTYGLGITTQHSVAMDIVESVGFCTTTPIDEKYMDLRMTIAVKKIGDTEEENNNLHRTILEENFKIFEEDIVVWSTRKYSKHENYYEGDGPIAAFREWAKSWYC